MTETYQVQEGWLELVSGTPFYFGAPTDDMILLSDVAYALSRICRYNGHTRRHYSVAEHAILLADWVAERPWSTPRDILTALHHDDAEYIVGDLARPIKVQIPKFKEIENVISEAIARKFGTHWPVPGWMKDLDARIIIDERRHVMNPSDNEWGEDTLEPLGVRFMGLVGRFPPLVQRAYLRRHHKWEAEARKWDAWPDGTAARS